MTTGRTTARHPDNGHDKRSSRWDNSPDTRPDYLDSHRASQLLGISEDAIRHRIARGKMEGYKEGGRWYVYLQDKDDDSGTSGPDRDQTNVTSAPESGRTDGTDLSRVARLAIATMEARIESLEAQLHAKDEQLSTKDQQIDQLHQLCLLSQTALSAAPVRPWWKLWG